MLHFAELYRVDQRAQLFCADVTEIAVSLLNGEKLIGIICPPDEAGQSNRDGAALAAMWQRRNPKRAEDGWDEHPTWFALAHVVTAKPATSTAS